MTDRYFVLVGVVIALVAAAGSVWSAYVANRAYSYSHAADRPRFSLTKSAEAQGTRVTMKLNVTNIGRIRARHASLKLWRRSALTG